MSQDQPFQLLLVKASDAIYDLGSQIRKVDKLLSRGNTASLATEMVTLTNKASQATSQISELSSTQQTPTDTNSFAKQNELNDQLTNLLSQVKNLQSTVALKLKTLQQQQEQQNQHSGGQGGQEQAAINENTPLFEPHVQQLQLQYSEPLNQLDLDTHTILVDDRDGSLAEIQRGTQEINSIFRDLGILIREQGQQIDSIEDNIIDLARQTDNGSRQLTKAYTNTKSRGKWSCILLLVLLVITILMSLIVIS